MRTDEAYKALRGCPLFTDLAAEEIKPLAALGRVEEFEAGSILYRQSDLGKKLYILVSGQVSLQRVFSLDGKRDARVDVYVARSDLRRSVLGCWCALVGEPHRQMCTAVCDKPTRVVCIPCEEIRTVLVQDTWLGMKVLEKLVTILRDRIEFSYGVMENL